MFYTSGSTGKPKAVLLTHRTSNKDPSKTSETIRVTAADRHILKSPLGFTSFSAEITWPLLNGARMVIIPPGKEQDIKYLVNIMAEQDITFIIVVPSMLRMLLEEPELDKCRSLKQIACFGEPLPPELREQLFARLDVDLIVIYGVTEGPSATSCKYRPTDHQHKVNIGRHLPDMGIITEIFRRNKDVLRSLNPAHPILAFGPDAQWITSDHDKTMYSCGKGSPFEKILQLNAKAFFFDVPFRTMTFFHYLEDKFKDCSPVKLYDDEALESMVIDSKGNEIRVKTYVFSKTARENRSARLIARELKMKRLMTTDTIGNTKLTLVNLRDVVGCAQKLVDAGIHFSLKIK